MNRPSITRLRFLGLAAASLMLSQKSRAQGQRQMLAGFNDPTVLFVPQQTRNWCWAACNQMLLRALGIEITQLQQAQKRQQLFGGNIDQGAGPTFEQAAPVLAGEYLGAMGKSIRVTPYVSYLRQGNPNDPMVILESLQRGIPLVMATAQHGRVCIGVDFVPNGLGGIQITTLHLLDPAHGLLPVPRLISMPIGAFLAEGGIGFMTMKIQTA